jgi:hypothetical protein
MYYQVEDDEGVGYVARMVEKRTHHRLLTGKPEGKRPQEDQNVSV